MKFYIATVVRLSEMQSDGKPAHGQQPHGSRVSNSKERLREWLSEFSDDEYHKVGPGKWRPRKRRTRESARQQRIKKRRPFIQKN